MWWLGKPRPSGSIRVPARILINRLYRPWRPLPIEVRQHRVGQVGRIHLEHLVMVEEHVEAAAETSARFHLQHSRGADIQAMCFEKDRIVAFECGWRPLQL